MLPSQYRRRKVRRTYPRCQSRKMCRLLLLWTLTPLQTPHRRHLSPQVHPIRIHRLHRKHIPVRILIKPPPAFAFPFVSFAFGWFIIGSICSCNFSPSAPLNCANTRHHATRHLRHRHTAYRQSLHGGVERDLGVQVSQNCSRVAGERANMSMRDWVGAGTRERVLTPRPTLGLSLSTKWAQRLGGDTSQDVMQGQREHGRRRQHAWSKSGTSRSEMEGRPQRDASTSEGGVPISLEGV